MNRYFRGLFSFSCFHTFLAEILIAFRENGLFSSLWNVGLQNRHISHQVIQVLETVLVSQKTGTYLLEMDRFSHEKFKFCNILESTSIFPRPQLTRGKCGQMWHFGNTSHFALSCLYWVWALLLAYARRPQRISHLRTSRYNLFCTWDLKTQWYTFM